MEAIILTQRDQLQIAHLLSSSPDPKVTAKGGNQMHELTFLHLNNIWETSKWLVYLPEIANCLQIVLLDWISYLSNY